MVPRPLVRADQAEGDVALGAARGSPWRARHHGQATRFHGNHLEKKHMRFTTCKMQSIFQHSSVTSRFCFRSSWIFGLVAQKISSISAMFMVLFQFTGNFFFFSNPELYPEGTTPKFKHTSANRYFRLFDSPTCVSLPEVNVAISWVAEVCGEIISVSVSWFMLASSV